MEDFRRCDRIFEGDYLENRALFIGSWQFSEQFTSGVIKWSYLLESSIGVMEWICRGKKKRKEADAGMDPEADAGMDPVANEATSSFNENGLI
jgi:hypothetical protein